MARRSSSFRATAVALALASAALAQRTRAQEDPLAPTPSTESGASGAIETAPVVVDGETLFRLRGNSSFAARRRASAVAAAIEGVASDRAIPVSELRIVEAGDRSNIVVGETSIVSIFDGDARVEAISSRQRLAEFYLASIERSITRYRHERSSAYLRAQAVHTAVAIALAVMGWLAARWAFDRTVASVERRFEPRLEQLEARSYEVLSVEQIRNTAASAVRALRFLFRFAVVFACLDYVLGLYPWTRQIARYGASLLFDPLRTMGSGLLDALPGLVFIAIVIVMTRYVLRLTSLFFGGIASGRIRPAGFDQHWAWPTFRLVRIAIIAFAAVLAYPYIPGSQSDAFKGISIFLGLLMSLGASSVVANALAGYTLIYRRAFKEGDRIQVGDVLGDVIAMRQQVTHLRTLKNEEVTIPSSVMLTSHVVNYSSLARERGLILHTTVGIGYETPWRQVEAMLLEAARRTLGLLGDPPPFVLQKALGDFAVTYELNAYCNEPHAMGRLYTALHQNILDVFNEYGVQIMTPAYEGDPERPKVVPPEQWHMAPAPKEEKPARTG